MQLRRAAHVSAIVALANRPADRGFSIVYLDVNAPRVEVVREVHRRVESIGYLVRDADRPATRQERRPCWHRHVVLIASAGDAVDHAVSWVRELGSASSRAHLLVLLPAPGGDGVRERPPAYVSATAQETTLRAVRRAETFARSGRAAAARRWLHAGVAEALRHGREDDAADLAARVARHHRSRGDWRAASRALDQVFQRIRGWPVRREAGARAVEAAMDCGDLDEAERRLSLVSAEGAVRGSLLSSVLRCLWAEIRLRQGRHEEAVAAVEAGPAQADDLRLWRGLLSWRLREPDRWPGLGEGAGPASAAARIFLAAAGGARMVATTSARLPEGWLSAQRDCVRMALRRAARDAGLQDGLPPTLVSPRPAGLDTTDFTGESRMHLIDALPTLLERLADAEDNGAAVASACEWACGKPGVSGAAAVGAGGVVVGSRGVSRGDLSQQAIRDVIVRGQARLVAARGRVLEVQPVRQGGGVIGSVVLAGDEQTAETLREAATAIAAVIGPALRAELDRRSEVRRRHNSLPEIVGRSPAMADVRDAVGRIAATTFPVLIEGESGTGKELVARAIHRLGARRERAFCPVNCAALTDDLLEAELFGHARGAFTGAVGQRAGLFEEADAGTLFMDEVAELSPRGQAKVLRALQEGEVRRLGENTARRVDARVVAATNRPLAEAAARGVFRDDLLFRLAVARVRMPPLRERIEDIPLLAGVFWRVAAAETGTKAVLGPEAVGRLCRHTWPGNVRELQNTMAALALIAPVRGRVGPGQVAQVVGASTDASASAGRVLSLIEARRQCERRCIAEALIRNGGRRSAAARQLGLTRQGLSKALRRVGLHVPNRTEGVA